MGLSSAAARLQALNEHLPSHTRLLAVSKGHPSSSIRELAEAGQRSFGESRLQEATAKQQELADLEGLDWHFIGRLQANKVRPVLKQFSSIHSVDSPALAERISRIAGEEGLNPSVFLQVKLRPDPNKGGLTADELEREWPRLQQLPNLRIVGLMTMAPLGLEAEQRQELFADCSALAQRIGLAELSMGMSGDWPEAAAAGSTWVRVGSALFGPKR
ncbi:YggS family pyridoxal phosphate-dependent enzyme [Synechococcus sp. A10-1-5-1]|uniref:YggS family pyridoxal phosphate-dependent enzyme n=1 Tax=Synechococcus sp. A10-1-5-1 TaxID=2936507 RepID=UPI002000B994|nr:YggS family pyridoxal phosphate-dependent enzyme [Synechococcus sp. A10-1-5-1]UPM49727.1 YggS family pyridoxal phosphate-dependent enzyme [Synechococcus sp. A10-1-5-1]